MADWTDKLPDAAKAYFHGQRLDEVECIISDLPGIARGKAVPASKFAKQSYFHLPDSIFYQTITGGWGEAAGDDGFIERDMILKPDFSTTSAAPWTGDWTLQVIHDAYDRDDKPIPYQPPQRTETGCATLSRQGVETDRGARDGVLSRRAQRRPGTGHQADDGPFRPPSSGPPGLFHDCRGRVRPSDRRHL